MTIGELIQYLSALDPNASCAYDLWLSEDVIQLVEEKGLDIAEEDMDSFADSVLYDVEHYKDASFGIQWDTLAFYIDEQYKQYIDGKV